MEHVDHIKHQKLYSVYFVVVHIHVFCCYWKNEKMLSYPNLIVPVNSAEQMHIPPTLATFYLQLSGEILEGKQL